MRIGLAGIGIVLSAALWGTHAQAAPLLQLSGRVSLLDGATPDGVKVVLGLDLDRDGALNGFETLTAKVAPDGSYRIEYAPDPKAVDLKFVAYVTRLAADFRARGFDAVLDDGPLPVVVRFEREGYSTIVKRFTTLSDVPSLDVALDALSSVACDGTSCLSPDGRLSLAGLPAGTAIARAFARAYDPAEDGAMFPGTFSDSDGNLLISSGFAEINLHDSAGKKITSVSSPASVRFEARRTSWASLRDLEPGSGRIEVPMYSFDEVVGEWVSEPNGELQSEDGTPIPEDDFGSIQDGSYGEPVYIAFETSHFSTFNCDAPVQERACVKGRIVQDGKPVSGVRVGAEGVSYRGNAGEVVTGADGWFAVDVMRSERPGEDYDRNRVTGEAFRARVTARLEGQAFQGEPFTTPDLVGSATSLTGRRCKPQECECVDLGDIDVSFDLPRPCTVTVQAHARGTTATGENGGPLATGEALVSAQVTGRLSGEAWIPRANPSDCRDLPCSNARVDARGSATFIVPVFGKAPKIELNVRQSLNDAEGTHYYEGRLLVDGCLEGEVALQAPVQLDASHVTLRPRTSSNPGPGSPGSSSPGSGSAGRGASCAMSGGVANWHWAVLGCSVLGLALGRRAYRARS